MGWYYDFYKIYKTKQEDVDIWKGKSTDELPEHLEFISEEFDGTEVEEIQKYLLPTTMVIDNTEYDGYLATLYPVALFGRSAGLVELKSPRSGWYHFVKLTNSRAKKMIKYAYNLADYFHERPHECLEGYLGKRNKYKKYPGKLRNIVYYHHQ